MNYEWHYDNLIKTRKLLNRKKYNGIYYEDHHIIMKSMNGTDDKTNRILLTAKEHYIAHYLLWRIHRNNKTALAFFLMCKNYNKTDIRISSRVYEEIRIECAEIASKMFKSQWNDPEKRIALSLANSIKNKGRKHNDDSKKNMSDAQKGKKQSQETINKRVSKLIGKKHSQERINNRMLNMNYKKATDETRKKQSISASNRILSEETKLEMCKKMSISKSKPRKQYKLISPTNQEHFFDGLKLVFEFAKDNNISITLLKDFKNKGKIITKVTSTLNSNDWELITI